MTKLGLRADENWLRGSELRSEGLVFWGFRFCRREVMELSRAFLGEVGDMLVKALYGRAIDTPKTKAGSPKPSLREQLMVFRSPIETGKHYVVPFFVVFSVFFTKSIPKKIYLF